MQSEVSICSSALVRLGAKPISSLDEASDQARTCAAIWESVRDDLLRLHPWNSATTRVQLAPLSAPPAFDFPYQFALPDDWLRTIQVGNEGAPMRYRTEGRRILAETQLLPLVYIFRNTNVGTWSANLASLAQTAMAANIAYSVTKSTSLAEAWAARFDAQIRTAKAIDGQEDPPEIFGGNSDLLDARYGYSYGRNVPGR
jgi:hypothetical protein